jgi:hypothetical protein
MGQESAQPALEPFPVRLRFVHLERVRFQANAIPEEMTKEQAEAALAPKWSAKVTSTISENRVLVVASLECVFDSPAEKPEQADQTKGGPPSQAIAPYVFEIAAVAGFIFDRDKMPAADVKRWCDLGSFFVISPFLRNAVAQVTRDSGFPEVLLPLFQVPILRESNRERAIADAHTAPPAAQPPAPDSPARA